MTTARKTKGVLYVRNINERVKRDFKALCEERKVNMTVEINRILRREILKHNRKVNRKANREASSNT